MPTGSRPPVPTGRRMMRRAPAPAPTAAVVPSTRRARGDDDSAEESSPSAALSSGRDGATKLRKSIPSNYAPRFVPPDAPRDDSVIIKFVRDDAVPIVTYLQHWPDWLKGGQGKQSFVCLGADCPLCNIGDRVTQVEAYNIIDLRDPAEPISTVLYASITLAKRLAVLDKNKKTGEYGELARDDMYYSIVRTGNMPGEKGRAETQVDPVKERDLAEEWGIDPLTEKELEEFEQPIGPTVTPGKRGCFSVKQIVQISSRSELQAAADAAPD